MIESFLASIEFEYRRYKKLADEAIAQITEADIFRISGAEDNSIAVIMRHISGNLKSRFTDFLTSDGEKPWRQRDTEFETPQGSRAELLKSWEAGWEVLFNTLNSLNDADLSRTVYIRQKPLTVAEALHRSLGHTAYHVGQIVYLAKNMAGRSWQSLTIPKGKSEDYNQSAKQNSEKE